jgi:hypothetical protein
VSVAVSDGAIMAGPVRARVPLLDGGKERTEPIWPVTCGVELLDKFGQLKNTG